MNKTQSTEQSQTQSTTPFQGQQAQWAESLYPKLNAGTNKGTATIADAFSNNTYGVGMNGLQKATYDRSMGLMKNKTLTDIAGGANFGATDVNKQIAPQIEAYKQAFGSSLDSLRGGFQRSGIASSSMRNTAENKLADTSANNLTNFVTDAFSKQRSADVNEMIQANQILSTAGKEGYTYQQADQASRDASISNALKAAGIDTTNINVLMQYLQLMKNPTVTATGNSTTTQNNGIGGLFGF